MKMMTWVAMPVRLDGGGYTLLMEQEDGPQIFGAWCAMIQVAAKCTPRGSFLKSDGKAMDFKAIARITRMPKELIEKAFNTLNGSIESDLDWIEEVSFDSQDCGNPAGDCGNPAGGCSETALHGMEWNGIEGKKEVGKPRAMRLPADWTPTKNGIDLCVKNGLKVDIVLADFKGYWLGPIGSARPDGGLKADWDRTWTNWIGRIVKTNPQQKPQPKQKALND
jgi:hypothetical protein